jgi:hypothetical protein
MRTFLAWLAAMFLVAAGGNALAQTSLELAIKATYLYKFGPFVDWPAAAFDSPTSTVNICVVGVDPFGAVLDQAVTGQRLAQHPIAVRRLLGPEPHCHIAFIAGTDAFVAQALDALRGTPVLTVTDVAPGNASHGIVNFVIDGNHVRFDIDADAAARNGISISSKLLSLARSVRPRA